MNIESNCQNLRLALPNSAGFNCKLPYFLIRFPGQTR